MTRIMNVFITAALLILAVPVGIVWGTMYGVQITLELWRDAVKG